MWKNKKKEKRKKIFAPTTEWLKKKREEDYERSIKNVKKDTKNE